MKKLAVVIYGPTGVGKTSASLSVAKRLGGEIISADSMQVYKGMNIGTAKISKEEMKGVKHHMLSIVSPNREFTVCDYVKRTKQKIDEKAGEKRCIKMELLFPNALSLPTGRKIFKSDIFAMKMSVSLLRAQTKPIFF